ncbi:MAG: hypothetical protein IH610_02340 [Deltaproteobacteria bacterium]|nr:hypothetical protein [Deltaproteobacteria bacterium]
MDPQAEVERKNFWRKAVAAVALLVIFGCVVFSVPSERLMWQGSYVMGILLLPKPSPAPYVRSEIMKENADASFNLLGFLSVAGILVLAIRKIPDLRPVRRALRLDHSLGVSIEEKITIMYIL